MVLLAANSSYHPIRTTNEANENFRANRKFTNSWEQIFKFPKRTMYHIFTVQTPFSPLRTRYCFFVQLEPRKNYIQPILRELNVWVNKSPIIVRRDCGDQVAFHLYLDEIYGLIKFTRSGANCIALFCCIMRFQRAGIN